MWHLESLFPIMNEIMCEKKIYICVCVMLEVLQVSRFCGILLRYYVQILARGDLDLAIVAFSFLLQLYCAILIRWRFM